VSALARYERLTARQVAGSAIGFVGVFLTISRGRLGWSGGSLRGDLLILGASVLWALYTVLARPLFTRYSPLKVTTYAMAVGSLMLVPFAPLVLNPGEFTLLSLAGWGWLLFATVCAFVIGFYLFYRGVARMGAPKAMLYLYTVPLFGIGFAYLLLHEGLSPAQGAGALIVFLAIAIVRR
jgi:drug/metabolite transporter (DMT)-like permease